MIKKANYLQHYGMPKRSGRYPYGSGEDPYQGSNDFLGRVEQLKKKGWSETPENIRKEFGISTYQYRSEISNAKNERKRYQVNSAKSMHKDGLSTKEISEKLNCPESTVRGWINNEEGIKASQATETANILREAVKSKRMVDIGAGVERQLGVSKQMLQKASDLLKEEGYEVYSGRIPQPTNKNQKTTQKVLCAPGTQHKEIFDYQNVHSLFDYHSEDGGVTFNKLQYPKSMDSKRLQIRYAEDGGINMDGVIELRRGAPDLSLGNSKYSQVRILVDDSHYLKGMAVYSDDLPDGVDVRFNTNKKRGTPMESVLKPIHTEDPTNPFGSLLKASGQSEYVDENGNKQLSLINKTREEGDWSDWQDAVPSQFLSKQSRKLASQQLDLAKQQKQEQFNEIMSLSNPTIKKFFLEKFADECEGAAVDLKAAALPGQKYHAILPCETLKENEVFAPKYPNGSRLALVRYPHAGTFEIPVLTVNNKNREAIKRIGLDADDAIGIRSVVAEQLSGADFDGDTVMCIPTDNSPNGTHIDSRPPLPQLKNFDSKSFGPDETKTDSDGTIHYYRNGIEYKPMSKAIEGKEMGSISNLISDMTLIGADDDDIANAVKHSMVVIDSVKHKLDYHQSYIDHNIKAISDKYRDGGGGAHTLISRAKGQFRVEKTIGQPYVNKKGAPGYDPDRPEGSLVYKIDPNSRYIKQVENKRTGEVKDVEVVKTITTTQMAAADDAYDLLSSKVSPHKMEVLYADYANSMKQMARDARLEMLDTPKIAYSPDAAKTYATEVASLKDKLYSAEQNKPKEREVNRRVAAVVMPMIEQEVPNKEITKIATRLQREYRQELGSIARRDRNITITDREWEAIQNGAISESRLKSILNNTDADKLRERAMPRATAPVSSSKVTRMKAMLNSGSTLSEVAETLGLSVSTVSKYAKK